MRIAHDRLPGHGRQRAAGHAISRAVVVVADPNATDNVAAVADEPGVAVGVGGPGLAGDPNTRNEGAAGGAFLGDLVHHHVHVGGDLRRHHLARLVALAVEPPDHLAAG